MICDIKYGPDSGGAKWICRGDHISGYLLVKSDGLYLLDSTKEEIEKVHEMDDAGDEAGEIREITYCSKCKAVNK